MRRRSVKALSIGYTIPRGGEKRDNGTNYLREIDLHEISVVLKPANPAALVQSVKEHAERLDEEGLAEEVAAKSDDELLAERSVGGGVP